jgi:hypothetical protein
MGNESAHLVEHAQIQFGLGKGLGRYFLSNELVEE